MLNFLNFNPHHNYHRLYKFLSIRIAKFYTLVYLYQNLLGVIMEIVLRVAV